MTNTKKIIIFIIIILIILAIALVIIFSNKKPSIDRVLNMYQKILDSKNYSFSMEEKNNDMEYKLSMNQKGDDYSIDTYLDDEHTTTLVLDKKIYYLMHDEKEYYPLEEDDEYVDLESDVYILESGLKAITQKEYTNGNEEINGKTYYYEEYDNDNSDFLLFADINETSKVKTRFYFDGENLVYIKNLITGDEGESEELINVNLVYEVNEELFKIPEDYAETED